MGLIGLLFFVLSWVVPITVLWWIVRTISEIRSDVRSLRQEVTALGERIIDSA